MPRMRPGSSKDDFGAGARAGEFRPGRPAALRGDLRQDLGIRLRLIPGRACPGHQKAYGGTRFSRLIKNAQM